MANMTFKASLLPNTDLGYSLGSDDKRWNIYGTLHGDAEKLKNIDGRRVNGSYMFGDGYLRYYLSSGSMTSGYPGVDGFILHGAWDWAGGYDAQLCIGNVGHCYVRSGRGGGNAEAHTQSWTDWFTILDSDNYASIIDGRYVNITGDTMTGRLTFDIPKNGDNGINAHTTNNTWSAIDFLDTNNDGYGIGVRIGAGGLAVIGAGESSTSFVSNIKPNSGSETLYALSDGEIFIESTCDTIANRKGIKISNGNVIPVAADANSNNTLNLGASGVRFARAYLGSADSYGGTAKPIYWNAGIPTACSATVGGGEQPIYMNAGTLQNTSYALKATVNNGTASRLTYYSADRAISATSNIRILPAEQVYSGLYRQGLRIWGGCVGNDSSTLKSGTLGVITYGDAGPQIQFDSSSANDGSGTQAGALIFTDHDSCAAGASFHFVSNQGDWNVTSKRFHAKTSISIGTNLPNTSYNFYLNGSGYLNSGYFYIGPGGGVLNGAATNGGINSIRVGDDVWLGDCNAGGIMGMKSTGSNCGFFFYNSGGTNIGQLYANGTYLYSNKSLQFGSGNGSGIYYSGSKANTQMIKFIDNSGDNSGNGISIGGGGATIIGGGESSSYASGQASGGSEVMWIVNDGAIEFYPNLQSGWTTSYKNWIDTSGYYHGIKVYGAVWNDYAECREVKEDIAPGKCVREVGDGTLIPTTSRLQRGCNIVSDTFGFAIGETERCNTPIAVSGRVLAYLYEDRELARQRIGYGVCSGPDGTVSIMTEEEERMYPNMIVGTISEVPNYEIWHAGSENNSTEIKVDGRIWIKVK